MTTLIAEKREEARRLLPEMHLPSRQHESWRRVNLGALDIKRYTTTGTIIEILEKRGAEILEGDAAYSQAILWEGAPEDLFDCANLAEAKTILIKVETSAHVRIKHSMGSNANGLHHRIYVMVPEGADASIIEETQGRPGDSTFWNLHTEIYAGAGSSVRHLSIRGYEGNEWNLHRLRILQKRDSTVHCSLVHSSGQTGKTFVTSRLAESGSTFRGVGMTTLGKREFLDVEMTAEHIADHTSSSLHYKTVLKGRAHSVFNGNLLIPPGVRDVQSQQINNNILLDSQARAESQPRLVIQSEEVSAEHGATVGEIDRDALFFLMSRGIPEAEARQLLMTGFLTQITEELPLSETEKEKIVSEFLKRLYEST